MLKKFLNFGFLAALVAGFSLFSLVVRAFDIGVSSILSDFLGFYREIIGWFFSWTKFLGFEVPAWYRDLFTLSAVGTGIMFRGLNWHNLTKNKRTRFHPEKNKSSQVLLLAVMSSATLAGLLGWITSIAASLAPRNADDKALRKELFLTLFTVIFIFATNAYGLSTAN